MYVLVRKFEMTEVLQSGALLPGFFSSVEQILTAFLGALLAYFIWDYLNRPHLTPNEVISKIVKQKKEISDNQTSHYLQVENTGRVPATRCRAELRLRGETQYPDHISRENQIIAVNLPLGWADMRGNLLVHQREDYSRNTRIPAGETVTTHLFRETTGHIMVAEWVDPSGKPVLTMPADEYNIDEVGKKFAFNDDSNKFNVDEPNYQQSRKIDYEKFKYICWETAEVIVSCEEGNTFRQPLSLGVSDSNNLEISIKNKSKSLANPAYSLGWKPAFD